MVQSNLTVIILAMFDRSSNDGFTVGVVVEVVVEGVVEELELRVEAINGALIP